MSGLTEKFVNSGVAGKRKKKMSGLTEKFVKLGFAGKRKKIREMK